VGDFYDSLFFFKCDLRLNLLMLLDIASQNIVRSLIVMVELEQIVYNSYKILAFLRFLKIELPL
jgi:hypothetical protein